jgi:hypothetical protein
MSGFMSQTPSIDVGSNVKRTGGLAMRAFLPAARRYSAMRG